MLGAFASIEVSVCAAATRNTERLFLGQAETIVQADCSFATAGAVIARFTLHVIWCLIPTWKETCRSGLADEQRSVKQQD